MNHLVTQAARIRRAERQESEPRTIIKNGKVVKSIASVSSMIMGEFEGKKRGLSKKLESRGSVVRKKEFGIKNL